ncbi:MAG: nitronate monooxygenase, partial [Actinobacteria bacterium]|nr:nitronate monooxygenase [Actinomycetota bacterium]
DLHAQIVRVRELTGGVFGVNLFLPGGPVDLDAARTYRDRLGDLAVELGVHLPQPRDDDDAFDAKCSALLDDPVPVVSFTFGRPGPRVVRRFRAAGSYTLATVTSATEAQAAAASGVDALVVQGPEAGGHRATFDQAATPPTQPLGELLRAVRATTDLPLVATGGLGGPEAVATALRIADAVQVGTALLDADEAGTAAAYRRALHDPRFTDTVITRAFSGRWARGLRNAFIETYGPEAPAAYPAVNQLTVPLRRAAAQAGDIEKLSLWAGTSWRSTMAAPAATIIDRLLSEQEG